MNFLRSLLGLDRDEKGGHKGRARHAAPDDGPYDDHNADHNGAPGLRPSAGTGPLPPPRQPDSSPARPGVAGPPPPRVPLSSPSSAVPRRKVAPPAVANAAPVVPGPADDIGTPIAAALARLEEPRLLRAGWALVEDRADRLVQLFYARFFLLAPHARELFQIDMSRQRDHFLHAIGAIVAAADDPDSMRARLAALGADHRKFDARPGQYEAAGAALLAALRDVGGAAWTPEMTGAWETAIGRAATIMREAAARYAGTPAYWTATVIGHERYGSDVAIIRVQPDQPYMYRAGQYLTLKLAQRGYDAWRPMSIASAPRGDNTLDFYVRAIAGGLVSPALVAHTRVGDELYLGPPLGGPLVADPAYTSGLVCIGGGVGASAIKAVVEQVARWRPPIPPVHAYIGMRRIDDLPVAYDLARTARAVSGITVTTIASDEPASYRGPRGLVGNYAAAAEGPQLAGTDWDVFVAGPPPMIGHCIRRFTDLGVPRARIRSDFDDYGLATVT